MRLLFFLLLGTVAWCQTEVSHLLEHKTMERLRAYDAGFDGVLGVAAIDLSTGRVLAYQADAVFPQASSIKIPIMLQVFRDARAGRLSLSDTVELTRQDIVGGSGQLQKKLESGPLRLTVREQLEAMIVSSDNVATNKLIAQAGMDRVNRTLDELHLVSTRLRRIMMDQNAARAGLENISTPMEMARLVEMIHRETAAAPEDCREMLAVMKRVKAGMRKAVPPEVEVASKPGGVSGVSCETGLVLLPGRPFVLSVMSTYLGEKSPVEDVARLIYAHFERLARANRYGHRLN